MIWLWRWWCIINLHLRLLSYNLWDWTNKWKKIHFVQLASGVTSVQSEDLTPPPHQMSCQFIQCLWGKGLNLPPQKPPVPPHLPRHFWKSSYATATCSSHEVNQRSQYGFNCDVKTYAVFITQTRNTHTTS